MSPGSIIGGSTGAMVPVPAGKAALVSVSSLPMSSVKETFTLTFLPESSAASV